MIFKDFLETEIKKQISSWNEDGIYVISFLVVYNECNIYKGIKNFPEFSVGYNTEQACNGASELSEDRWNFACWPQNNEPIISYDLSESADLLLEWYKELGIKEVGVFDGSKEYDNHGDYIGKGPSGYIELLNLVSDIGRKLQTEGLIKEKFGSIPVVVHDYEYAWYSVKATENANPNGEADTFLKALDMQFEG